MFRLPFSIRIKPLYSFVVLMAVTINPFSLAGDPIVDSWFTDLSGRYASLFETTADRNTDQSVTTWSHGQGHLPKPAYAGVLDVRSTADSVYIHTSGLPFHKMGPWYLNGVDQLFPNFPANLDQIWVFPRTPTVLPTKDEVGLGFQGMFVDGVSMFNFEDGLSYSTQWAQDIVRSVDFPDPNNSNQTITVDKGDEVWNRDAFHNESITFDVAFAHQAQGTHHYHASPLGLRHLLGDNVEYIQDTPTGPFYYKENAALPAKHSPLLGFARDGHPVYGPYAFASTTADPTDSNEPLKRMISGYVRRDYSSSNNQRTSLPQWVFDLDPTETQIGADNYGPDVSSNFQLGHYAEDYEYRGNLANETLGTTFDLDIYNGRFCNTPEFPNGTYAYFIATEIDPNGNVLPAFPYILGKRFFGVDSTVATDAASRPDTIDNGGTAELHFSGPANVEGNLNSIEVDQSGGDVVISWDAAQGGNYLVESTTDGTNWTPFERVVSASSEVGSFRDPNRANTDDKANYRVELESIDPFENDIDLGAPLQESTLITFTLSGSPPADLDLLPDSVLFNGAPVTVVSRGPSANDIQIRVPTGLAAGTYALTATWVGDTYSASHELKNNILLLIADDWGIDHSPFDNTNNVPLATMPNLDTIARDGVRFTRAYANPSCSPTRAAILTGRQAFRTTVGSPPGTGFGASEQTIPRVIDSTIYGLASFGKWHLSGGNTGYSTRGGWPYFVGSNDNPDNYDEWSKNRNSVISNSATYTTTDQVDEAKTYIDSQETNGKPWFVWMGFNAPHAPFHDPEDHLHHNSNGGGSSEKRQYIRMLEAMDTEIGRLLESVDLARTNIIVIGDNGSPNEVVQAPYGFTPSSGVTPGISRGKGRLYEGGIHVPLLVSGPAVQIADPQNNPYQSTDELVHASDLYSTIIEMAGFAVPANAGQDSKSLVPILAGTPDTALRYASAEIFDPVTASNSDGRSMRLSAHPDFKFIAFGNPNDRHDVPSYEFYHLGSDPNEARNLSPGGTGVNALAEARAEVAALTAPRYTDALAAFDACVAQHQALGGGFSDPAVGPEYTIYLHTNPGTGPNSSPASVDTPTSADIESGLPGLFETRIKPPANANRVTAGDDKDWHQVKLEISVDSPPFDADGEIEYLLNNGNTRTLDVLQMVVLDENDSVVFDTRPQAP